MVYFFVKKYERDNVINLFFYIQISRGPTYRLVLRATANKPVLEFSFNHYDFGPCYIRDITAPAYHVDLRITNLDDVPYM